MDSNVEHGFPLSVKRQSNLYFWPLFDEKLNFCFEWKEPDKNGAKFSTNHWLVFETSISSYIDVSKQSKETENRDTFHYFVLFFFFAKSEFSKSQSNSDGSHVIS